MGWVNRVVPEARLSEAVHEWCEEILQRSPQSLRFIKIALNQASDEQCGGVVNGGFVTSLLQGTEEFREGMQAIHEKRPPEFFRWRQAPRGDEESP